MKNKLLFSDKLHDSMQKFSISQYAYVCWAPQKGISPNIVSNYPQKWLTLYHERRFYLHDPILQHSLTSIKPFPWSDALNDLSSKELQYTQLASEYLFGDGYTFVLHDGQNNVACLNVANKEKFCSVTSFYQEIQNYLQMLLIDIHGLYLKQNTLANNQSAVITKNISAREKEVLVLISNGNTYGQVASIMGITVSTVKHHIINLKRKLEASNSKHIICKAKELCLI